MAKRTLTDGEKLAAMRARIARGDVPPGGTVFVHPTTDDAGNARTFIVATG